MIKEINLFCATVQILSLIYQSMYYYVPMNQDQTYLHTGSVTLHRQLFSNEQQGAKMCFPCLA